MSMETKVGGDVIYNGKILRLDRDEVALSDGSHSYREIVRHNGGAGVLFVRDGKILLVKKRLRFLDEGIGHSPRGILSEFRLRGRGLLGASHKKEK